MSTRQTNSRKIRQRFANVSVRQKTFPKDLPMIHQRVSSPKTIPQNQPKIRQRVSSPKTSRQRFANMSVPQKPLPKDSPTCHFAKNIYPMIRQKTFPKDSPDSPQNIPQRLAMIRQRVSAPKNIPQTFANDTPCQFVKPTPQRFAKDSRTCQFAKKHSPKICQRPSSPKSIR